MMDRGFADLAVSVCMVAWALGVVWLVWQLVGWFSAQHVGVF